MSNEIAISIISGIVGLVSAAIALFQAARASRLNADSNMALERIRSEASLTVENAKNEQEKRKKAFELAIDEARPIEAALAQAWHDIQSIKETMSKYTSGFGFDHDSAIKTYHSACSSLSEGYATWGTQIPDDAKRAWHRAKGYSNAIDLMLWEREPGSDEKTSISATRTEQLQQLRNNLTDCQMAIGLSRHTVRDTLMKRVLEIMK